MCVSRVLLTSVFGGSALLFIFRWYQFNRMVFSSRFLDVVKMVSFKYIQVYVQPLKCIHSLVCYDFFAKFASMLKIFWLHLKPYYDCFFNTCCEAHRSEKLNFVFHSLVDTSKNRNSYILKHQCSIFEVWLTPIYDLNFLFLLARLNCFLGCPTVLFLPYFRTCASISDIWHSS